VIFSAPRDSRTSSFRRRAKNASQVSTAIHESEIRPKLLADSIQAIVITQLRLQHLIALVEHAHFGRAAEALHISQPTLSKSIQGLEAELGVKLLDRKHGAITPTVFGQHVLERAGTLLTAEDDLRREIALLANQEIGYLKVAFGPYPSVMIGYPGIARLLAKHPKMEILAHVTGWRDVMQQVAARTVDLGIAEISNLQGNEKFTTERIGQHRGYFFCRPDHPILKQHPIVPKDIFEFPWVTTRLPSRIVANMPDSLGAAGTIDLVTGDFVPAIEIDVPMQLPEMLAGSDVLVAATLNIMQRALLAGEVTVVPIQAFPLQTNYGFISLKERTLPPAAQAFMQVAREVEAEITKEETALAPQFGLE
jgi:DNA-binding transcriptional LysR family regulator